MDIRALIYNQFRSRAYSLCIFVAINVKLQVYVWLVGTHPIWAGLEGWDLKEPV